MSLSIGRIKLWRLVNLKIKRAVHFQHVFAVMNILFDEIVEDLKAGKEIEVKNFGTFVLKQMKPRKYIDIKYKTIMESPGNKLIRLTLTRKISKKLCEFLDLEALDKEV